MATIVDRRTESGDGRFRTSRERFLQKNKKAIKEAVTRKIAGSDLDSLDKGGLDVSVPQDGISEPVIHHGKGGRHREVRPGNKEFSTGQQIPKPQGGVSGGGDGNDSGEPSSDGEGEDSFTFYLNEDETLDILFEDLSLPNLSKQNNEASPYTQQEFQAHVRDGILRNLDMRRSKKEQIVRHAVSNKKNNRNILELLKEKRLILAAYESDFDPADDSFARRLEKKKLRREKEAFLLNEISRLDERFNRDVLDEDGRRLDEIDREVDGWEAKKSLIPQWDERRDFVYKRYNENPVPIAKAAVFCMMDVSGSMTEERKANAKLFYWLLKKFLDRNYEHVELVFIRHTDVAEEVDEQTFFYDPQSGGTQVSSALEEMKAIMATDRFPLDQWNVYGAQASDGENSSDDNANCVALLHEIMPNVQAYFYTQIAEQERSWQVLWETYREIADEFPNKFFMGKIRQKKDISLIFRDFFSGREEMESLFRDPTARFFGPDHKSTRLEIRQDKENTLPRRTGTSFSPAP